MSILMIINDAPYGTEAAYNALRLARALQKERENLTLNIFLMSDAVGCAVEGQSTPDDYYNVERMLRGRSRKGCRPPLRHVYGRARDLLGGPSWTARKWAR